MNPSTRKNKGLKTESKIKEQKKKNSFSNRSVKNIPEINSTFFENTLDAMLIGSQDGHIYAVNPAACRMLGMEEIEVCRLGREGITEQTPELIEGIRNRKESGSFFGELIFIRKDGTRFPAEVSSSVFTLSDSNEFTTILIRDISERKKTEQALYESEALLNSIIDSTTDLIWSVDTDRFRLLTYNRSLDEFFKREGIHIRKGMLLDDILPPQLVKKLNKLYTQTLYKGTLETEYQTTLGNRTLHINLNLLSHGSNPYAISVFAKDITELKQSESALKQANEFQQNIIEGSIDAIFISDENSLLIAVNKAACILTGYSKEQLLKMSIPDLHDEIDLEAYRKYNKRIFKGEKILSEAKIKRKDGTKVDTEFNNSLILISGKSYMHTIARDISERKKNERKLFESGEKYRLLMENSGLGIAYYDIDGKILMFNQQAIVNLGGKAEDYIGKNLTQVFGEEAGQLYIDRIKLAAKSENPLKFEDNINLNGKPGWYMSTYTLILDQSGNVDGVQVIADNITERKINEERIKTSEAEYRSLFENSIMGISQSYPQGGYMRINRAYAEMYGYPDIKTMVTEVSVNIAQLYSNPDDRQSVLDILEREGVMPPKEFELKKRNGEKFWALVSARQVKDNKGKLLYLQAEHLDISSRKRLENEMYSASLYARNLIEASLDPLVTINSEGKITDVNSSTEKITGLSRKKLIGSDFLDYFTEPDKAREGYKIVFSKGEVKDYPLTLRHQNGRTTDVLYNATLFKNDAGEVQGVFAAARDITVQKKMEEELRKSHELLEKLNQHLVEVIENERNQIALNLHDDLGQKLTAINLDIAWLKSRIGVQSKTVREKIEDMSLMIKEIIENIRETSTLLRPSILFDLGLVAAIKSQMGSFEKQTGITCHFYYEPEEFDLEDSIALILYRILQESLTNIARHSGASSAEIELNILKNKIEMVIKDDGTGIEKNNVNSLKSMGIAGMRERVKSVHGKITFTGERGSGTIIKVIIPIIKEKRDD